MTWPPFAPASPQSSTNSRPLCTYSRDLSERLLARWGKESFEPGELEVGENLGQHLELATRVVLAVEEIGAPVAQIGRPNLGHQTPPRRQRLKAEPEFRFIAHQR